MFKAHALALAVLAAGISGCALNKAPSASLTAAKSIRVATWNMEHLAEANGVGCRPRTDADYARMRSDAAALNADVIAFQEVETKAAAERVFDPALYDVVISGRPMSGRGGACNGKSGLSIRQQDVGFAIRKGVDWSRNPDVQALGLGNPDLRWGVDITVRGSKPLRLLAVHLKSGCNIGRDFADTDCPVLFSQEPVLKKWIEDRVRTSEAFAILGDWNRRLSSAGDQFFAALDRAQPKAADLTLTNDGRSATCNPRYRDFIDYIVAGADAAKLIVPGSFAEYTYGVPVEQHPSDHCPVSVSFRA
ncbi:endonuclease/exonuclease/phosphatase [Sphingomonas sp. Leaf33]|uniref:endonuclease/exonuclease/phosphatase family protein n=1 Tax=Sphingomonas sp. Leaf33 TaxID=1736215 RepID=UPI0006FF969B|nr:endonuclease/exonuclease/phosphatase family protein [Sphingomonas sp. Leaf33]KQN19440.1 endonuclease/exonuclease/phosphatase [Sphingomonas sp. Leaf33]